MDVVVEKSRFEIGKSEYLSLRIVITIGSVIDHGDAADPHQQGNTAEQEQVLQTHVPSSHYVVVLQEMGHVWR